MQTSYAGDAGLLLLMKGKITIEKVKRWTHDVCRI